MSFIARRFRTVAIAAVAAATALTGVLTGLGPAPSVASSHREAPLVAADPQIDSTDLYAFVSPDKPDTVTLISNWIPFEEPAGGPNFYSFAQGVHYDINIDNNGDAKPDVIFRWVFKNHYRNTNTFLYNTGVVNHLTDSTLNFYQTYKLYRIDLGRHPNQTLLVDDAIVAPSDVGDASMPSYATLSNEAIVTGAKCGSCLSWAGQADDPFFLDLRVFDLLYGANLSEVGHDTLNGFNVNSFALQIPSSMLVGKASPIVGVWTTASRRAVRIQRRDGSQSFYGPWVQVSRLGMPLVNEVVIPVGKKDRFSAARPGDDVQFLPYVVDPEVPHLINAIYGIPIPDCDGNPNDGNIDRSCDLVKVFLTGVPGLNMPPNVRPSEELRLNTSIPPCVPPNCTPNRLGVIGGDNAGYPNGRRLADDVIDITLQVAEGFLLGQKTGLGDKVDMNDKPFLDSFPYLAYPTSGSVAMPHGLKRPF